MNDEKETVGLASSFEEYKTAMSEDDDVDIELTKCLYDENPHLKLVTNPRVTDEGKVVFLESFSCSSLEEIMVALKERTYLYMAFKQIPGSQLSSTIIVRCA